MAKLCQDNSAYLRRKKLSLDSAQGEGTQQPELSVMLAKMVKFKEKNSISDRKEWKILKILNL